MRQTLDYFALHESQTMKSILQAEQMRWRFFWASQIEIMSSEEESQAIFRARTQRMKPHAASEQSALEEDRQKNIRLQ